MKLLILITICMLSVSMKFDYDSDTQLQAEMKLYKVPYREVAIIVSKTGFYPEAISVFEGERVRFFVTSTMDEPGCFIVGDKKVFLAANKGSITEQEMFFKDSGTLKFHCPTGKMSGTITVIPKDRENKKRVIASEGPIERGPWVPREY